MHLSKFSKKKGGSGNIGKGRLYNSNNSDTSGFKRKQRWKDDNAKNKKEKANEKAKQTYIKRQTELHNLFKHFKKSFPLLDSELETRKRTREQIIASLKAANMSDYYSDPYPISGINNSKRPNSTNTHNSLSNYNALNSINASKPHMRFVLPKKDYLGENVVVKSQSLTSKMLNSLPKVNLLHPPTIKALHKFLPKVKGRTVKGRTVKGRPVTYKSPKHTVKKTNISGKSVLNKRKRKYRKAFRNIVV